MIDLLDANNPKPIDELTNFDETFGNEKDLRI